MNTIQSQSDPVVDEVNRNSLEAEATFLPDPAMPPAPAPGEVLKKAREARGESLDDVARTLKLSAYQLEALEEGRFDVLPGPTFVRGFLRNYARYLNISPEPLLEGISVRTPTAADLASMIKLDGNVQPKASPRSRNKVIPVVLIVLVALALVLLVGNSVYKRWFQFRLNSQAAAPVHEKTIQPEPQKTAVQFKPQVIKLEQPVPVNIAPESARDPLQVDDEGVASASDQAPAVPQEATLRLLFNASTLAQVRDSSGRLIFTRTGSKGSSNSVKGKPPFSVMVRQANNVELEFNGQAVDLKGHTSRDGIARLILQ